jgi:UDPglucose--hexose-1-phosphate uridylyltransferase
VPNKFPALAPDKELLRKRFGVFEVLSGFGVHEVIVETPDHNRYLKDQSLEELNQVLGTFCSRIAALAKDRRLRYITIFRNEGPSAGASLEHPHSQLIATPVIPRKIREELDGVKAYFNKKGKCVYCDILRQELKSSERIVYENEAYVSFCPFASRFPFEIWLLPKKHNAHFASPTTKKSISLLSDALKSTIKRLSVTLRNPAYNYCIHTAPLRSSGANSRRRSGSFHWHIEIIPRLIQPAGFELGTDFFINPTLPEEAARSLRAARGRKSETGKL